MSGELLACLAGQALLYGGAVLLIETGVLPRLWRHAKAAWRGRASGTRGAGYQQLAGEEPAAAAAAGGAAGGAAAADAQSAAHTAGQVEAGEAAGAEDPDVAAERRSVQNGRLAPASVAVLLQGVSKTFWQPARGLKSHGQEHGQEHGPAGHAHGGGGAGGSSSVGTGGPVHAVRDLWLGIGRHEPPASRQQLGTGTARRSNGECFGLLGVNGAGKTTTWRMVTGGWCMFPLLVLLSPGFLPAVHRMPLWRARPTSSLAMQLHFWVRPPQLDFRIGLSPPRLKWLPVRFVRQKTGAAKIEGGEGEKGGKEEEGKGRPNGAKNSLKFRVWHYILPFHLRGATQHEKRLAAKRERGYKSRLWKVQQGMRRRQVHATGDRQAPDALISPMLDVFHAFWR